MTPRTREPIKTPATGRRPCFTLYYAGTRTRRLP